jgi:probable blue pigment (indigoidine) exporter
MAGYRGRIALAAGLINGLGVLCYWQALSRLEASVATVLFALAPLFVLGALALRGERFTWRQIVRLVLGLVGVYLLVGPGGEVDRTGVALVVLAIIAFTAEITTVQWYLNDQDTRTVTLYVLLGMWLSITIGWLVAGADTTIPNWKSWLVILILGVFSTYIGWWVMFRAIQLIGSGQYALLLPVETLLAIMWSYLWLGERLRPLQWAGCLLILLSAILAVQRLGRIKNRRRWRVWLRPTR